MPESIRGVESQIEAVLRGLDDSRRLKDARAYTKAVKLAVKAVGKRLNFNVYASGLGDEGLGERMYDLSWWREDDLYLLDEPLVLECEWGTSRYHVLYDFRKLLVTRASLRVFLCHQELREDWDDCVQALIEQIHNFQGTQAGDRYLLGNWTNKGWKFVRYRHPEPIPKIERVWIFQATPDRYSLPEEMKIRGSDDWLARKHRDNLRTGNIALLWQSGPHAGVYGVGRLTSRPFKLKGDYWINIDYTKLLFQPLLKEAIKQEKSLRKMQIFRFAQGTNFRVTDGEWYLLKQLSHELKSISANARDRRRAT